MGTSFTGCQETLKWIGKAYTDAALGMEQVTVGPEWMERAGDILAAARAAALAGRGVQFKHWSTPLSVSDDEEETTGRVGDWSGVREPLLDGGEGKLVGVVDGERDGTTVGERAETVVPPNHRKLPHGDLT